MRAPTTVPLDPQAEKWLAKAKPSVAKDFIRLFLPAALFLFVLVAAYHYIDNRQAKEAILATERTKLALAEQTLNAEMDNTVANLRILARSKDVKSVVANPDGEALSPLIQNFSDHIEEIGNYDYISLLNDEGRDLVRVKGTTGIAVAGFSDSRLSPHEQAFFRQTLAAPKNSLHISTPFIERGSAKLRSWPALLFGTPIYGASGSSRGALLISYPIATLTMQLDSLFTGALGHISVLNDSGQWLYDQTQLGSEWGNMFQEGHSFATSHADVWKAMQGSASGRIRSDGGIYLFTTLHPLARQRPHQNDPARGGQEVSWKIVSFLDNASLSTWKSRAATNSPFYALFIGFLGVALWHRAQSKASQKLVDEATRLAAKVMDSRAAAIFITDTEGRMLALNPTLLNLTGFTEQELLYQKKELFFSELEEDHPDNPFWKRVSHELAQQGEWEGEIHCRRQNGETFPAYLLVGLIRDKHQHATHYVAILNDITVRKQAEEALRESQARFRQLIDQASDGIYVMDLDGSFLDVNQQACLDLGYSREELQGMNVGDVELDIPREQLRTAFRQMRPGEARTFYGTHRRKDGSTYPLEARSGLTVIGGKPHVITLVRDITERLSAERALRDSEASLARAQQIAHLGNWDWDIAANELRWSEEIYRIFGLDPRQFGATYEAFLATVHPDDVEKVKAGVKRSLQGLAPYNLDHRIILPDGTVRHVHEQAEILFGAEGKAVRMIGTVQDISERKQAEESMRASHEMFVTVMDSMEAVVYVADLESHELLFANKYTTEVFGGEPLTGKICWQTLQSNQAGPCSFCTNAQLMGPDGTPAESVVWELKNTANDRWYHIHDRAIRWIDGRWVRLEIATDITGLKETEAALRESRTNLNKAQEIAHVGNWEWLAKKGQTRWSEEIYRIVGLPVPEGLAEERLLDDEAVLDTIHPQDRNAVYEARQGALAGDAPYNLEFRVIRPSGETRFVHVMGEVLPDGAENPANMIGTIQDITERKQLENLQARHQRELEHAARLNIVGEMASGLAHELSQPLSATQNYLRGCIRRLQAQELDQETLLDVLRLASTQTERAADIISHIKEFARKREPVRCLLDLRQVSREVLILLEQELKKNRVSVVTSFPEEGSFKVVADKVELEQVMVNLIKNAIEAMQASETKRIAILAESVDGMLQVDIADTGPGIPESQLTEIFQPFFTTKQEGMGLGLSISHSIIEAQGGRLWATSNPQGGTTFHFTLPLEDE